MVICCSAIAFLAQPDLSAATVDLDQGPILRVLREGDVVSAENAFLPSGPLTVRQFVAAGGGAAKARSAEFHVLNDHGFESAAISEFLGPGSRRLRSSAIEFESHRQAAQALSAEAQIVAGFQRPPATRASIESESLLKHGKRVTLRPRGGGKPVGLSLLACSGRYLYIMRGTGDHGGSAQSFVRGLLKTVIGRG
jgi:hypothetical protein